MDNSNQLYAATGEEWRRWLEENYKTEREIWLVYPRKHSGLVRIPYNRAVEEALCFDWIDSTIKTIGEDRYCQRFTPRKAGSSYSQTNIERLRRLVGQGRVMPEFLQKIEAVLEGEFVFSPDIASALRADEEVWQNFRQYSEAYQRIRIAYVDTARKRPAEFEKRLRNLIAKTKENKQFGFGIEDYY